VAAASKEREKAAPARSALWWRGRAYPCPYLHVLFLTFLRTCAYRNSLRGGRRLTSGRRRRPIRPGPWPARSAAQRLPEAVALVSAIRTMLATAPGPCSRMTSWAHRTPLVERSTASSRPATLMSR
jgi:hypothetical protein